MSIARRCDICDQVFEPERGCISLDVHICISKPNDAELHEDNWSNVDFCLKCSKPIYHAARGALMDLDIEPEIYEPEKA